MAKEFAIGIYLFCFKVLFSIFKLFPLYDKTTFVTSFGDNCQYIADEMDKQDISVQKVFLMKSSSSIQVKDDGETIVLPFESKNISAMIRSIYHLATSKWIIIDNYFGFLSAISFKKQVTCVQVWHAAGAVKQFGAKDPSIKNRSAGARKRFFEVYDKFDYVTAGSERMAEIYQESFQLPASHILRTGIPRTDFFFNDESKRTARNALLAKYPELEHKKIMLYAPTFRNDGLNNGEIALDLELLYKELKGEKYALLLKLHPAVKAEHDLPKLPVARVLWKPYPDMKTGCAAWIYAGGAHHTGYSQNLTSEQMEDFASFAGIEFVLIGKETNLYQLKNELRWSEAYYR